MRTLTPTLLAAQRSLGGVPSLRLRIEDRELRWMPLIDADSSTRLTNACSAAGGVLRARSGPGGTLDLQRVASPELAGDWQGWTPVAAGVAAASDLALSALDGDPARVRLFFLREGGGPYRLSWVQSDDGGATWSAPADLILALPTAELSLASANAQLLYHDPGDGRLKLAVRSGWTSGAWTLYPWAAAGSLAGRRGLAAGYRGGTYYVASCDQEAEGLCRLRTGTCQAAGGDWTAPVAVVPPGIPAAAFVPRCPSLAFADGLWHLAYLEAVTGTLTQTLPLVMHSADWEHWSYAAWVPLQAFGPMKRAALVAHGRALYLTLEDAAWQARLYGPEDGERNLVTDEVVSYVVEEEPWQGRALVEIHNPGGRYDGLGQPGTPGAAAKPLARVLIERGFRTAAGEERVERQPYYIVQAAIRRGGRQPGLRLECEDGWGLLRRWRPDALYVWEGKTIPWLISEILYRAAGLGCSFDGAEAWTTVLDSFAIAPGGWDEAEGWRRAWSAREPSPPTRPGTLSALRGDGLAAVRALLAKVGGAARWQADGSLHCFVPRTQAIYLPYPVGGAGEVLDALYGRGLAIPSMAQVYGDGVAGSAAVYDPASCPRRFAAVGVDPHLDTAARCTARAGALVYEGQARSRTGWIETPCQCGLELLDPITLEDARAGELLGATLRVVGIVERYDRAAGLLTTRATFEGA